MTMSECTLQIQILLTAVFAAHFNNFITVKRFYQLTINLLSEKMCTFAPWLCLFMFGDCKDNQKGRHLRVVTALIII